MILAALLLLQDVDALLRDLRADDAAVRDAATEQLKALGPDALPALRAAAADPDPDVASRVRFACALIELRESFSPDLRAAFPGLAERLVAGDDGEWTAVFLDAVASEGGVRAHPTLGPRDVAPLAVRAVRGAAGSTQRRAMMSAVYNFSLREAIPGLAGYLDDPVFGQGAIEYLAALEGREAIPGLVEALRSGPPIRRALAHDALIRLHAVEAVPAIEELLEDADPEARVAAVWMLHALLGADSFPLLRARLEDPSPAVRAAAIRALQLGGHFSIVPTLARFLEDSDPAPRLAAVEAVRTFDYREADLDPLLNDESPEVRDAVVLLLADRGRSDVVPALLRMEGHRREDALRRLIRLAPAEAQELALTLLDDESGDARAAAVHALASPDRIAECLDDPSSSVRSAASSKLHGVPAARLAKLVEPHLSDPSDAVRNAARSLLVNAGAFNDPAILEGMIESDAWGPRAAALRTPKVDEGVVRRLLEDPDPRVQEAAIDAARRLKIAEAGQRVAELLASDTPVVRRQAALFLATLEPASPLLVPLMRDPDKAIRRMAVEAVTKGDVSRCIGELIDALADPDSQVTGKARDALVKAADVGALAGRLDDPDARIRAGVLSALQKLDPREPLAAVEARLADPDPWVRTRAIAVLEQWHVESAAPAVIERLNDESPGVREMALSFVAAVTPERVKTLASALLEDPSPDVRAAAAAAFLWAGERPDPARLLRDPADEVRAIGVGLCEPSALVEALDDPSSVVREGAAIRLAEAPGPETAGLWAALLASPGLFSHAETALRRLPVEAANPPLLEMLRHPSPTVRAKATELLRAWPAESTAAIERLLDDPDPEVKVRVLQEFDIDATTALDDPNARVRLAAVERMEDPDRWAARLEDASPDVRAAAARRLVLAGDRRGAAAYVEAAAVNPWLPLAPLNAFRFGDAWDELRISRCGVNLYAPPTKLLEMLAADTGRTIDRVAAAPWQDRCWDRSNLSITKTAMLADALDALMRGSPYDWIVEPDRLRVVPRDEVIAFWRKWLDDRADE